MRVGVILLSIATKNNVDLHPYSATVDERLVQNFFFCFLFSKSVCILLQAFRQSSKEYQAVREKYAAQRKEIEEGLSK